VAVREERKRNRRTERPVRRGMPGEIWGITWRTTPAGRRSEKDHFPPSSLGKRSKK